MKKYYSKLLAILCAACLTISAAVPAFAADISNEPQEYATTAVTRGPITFPVSFGSDDIALYDQFAAMSRDDLITYINNLSPDTQSRSGIAPTSDMTRVLAAKGFIALVALFVKEDLPCAAELVLHSLAGEDYVETSGIFTEAIKQSPSFLNWIPTATAGAKKEIYYGPNEVSDLYYSLRHVTFTCLYVSTQGKTVYLEDIFDFKLEMCETLKATLLNTGAWLLTQTDVMNEITLEISFIY